VNIFKFVSFTEIAALRPGMACELLPAGVVAARADNGQEIASAFVTLPQNTFSPSMKPPFFSNREAVVEALRQALDSVRQRDNKVSLVIPDLSVRVLLLDFDELPDKPTEAMPILRFRLRKLVAFDIEDAAVSCQIVSRNTASVRTIVTVTPNAVVAEYEGVVREAGYEPGVILPSSLAAMAAMDTQGASLLVNHNGSCITTAITNDNNVLLYRTLELGVSLYSLNGMPHDELQSEAQLRAADELHQSVSVAIAYFEDTIGVPPQQLFACGLGGAETLNRLVGDFMIPIRDLVATPSIGNTTSIPRGAIASVAGALTS
jgi:type IV pilus assembly protein PilM